MFIGPFCSVRFCLGIVGRDHYGVFPLRGKLRNVRELTVPWSTANPLTISQECYGLLTMVGIGYAKLWFTYYSWGYISDYISISNGFHEKSGLTFLPSHFFDSISKFQRAWGHPCHDWFSRHWFTMKFYPQKNSLVNYNTTMGNHNF